jgi:ATP-dependent Clp protease ATP-binding subunit ClpC
MSEYSEKFNVSKLIGSPPGYVGYDEGGQLTEKVRRNPYSIILLDEIEKAHPEVFNSLLQILEDGRLTDGKGRVVDFKNTIVIATSNIGAEIIQDYSKEGKVGNSLGFDVKIDKDTKEETQWDKVKKEVLEELSKNFKPEFINRIDEVIIFESLSKDQIREIIKLELDKVIRIVKAQKIEISFDKSLIERVFEKGFNDLFGARELRRVIQKEVETKISELILDGSMKENKKYVISFKKDALVVKNEK